VASVTSPSPVTPPGLPLLPSVPPPGQAPTTSTPPLPAALVLEPDQVQPGESFVARGTGCAPGATVTLRTDREALPTTTADASGSFSQRIALHKSYPGSAVVIAQCGSTTLRATLTVLVSSGIATPMTSLSVLLFFLLVVGVIVGRWVRGRER